MGIKNIIGKLGLLPRLAMDAYDKEHDKAEALKAENEMYKADQARLVGMNRLMGKKKGGMVGSASKRADGCATKGKTRGKIV